MLTVMLVVSILIQLVLPFVLGFFIIRRFGTEWKIYLVGVLAYLVASVVQIQVYDLLGQSEGLRGQLMALPAFLSGLILAFLPAVIENIARWVSFKVLKDRSKSWGAGLTIAAGHGAIESAMIGMQLLMSFILVVQVTSAGIPSLNLEPADAAKLELQLADFLGMPVYLPLIWALQRLAAISWQFALGIMVWIGVTHKKWLWVGVAVVWQTMINVVIQNLGYADMLPSALVLTLVMAVNIVIVFLLYRQIETLPVPGAKPGKPSLLSYGNPRSLPQTPPAPQPTKEKPASSTVNKPGSKETLTSKKIKPVKLDKDLKE